MIIIINTAFWFRMAWQIISPFVHPNTRAKVKICGAAFQKTLFEVVGEENVPREYGGKHPLPLGQSEEESLIRNHVNQILSDSQLEQK